MSKLAFAWTLLGIYGLATALLTYRGFRRTRSVEGFAVGNRDISPYLVGLSLAAQLTSVATFVVNPGLIYAYGLSALVGMAGAACLGIIVGVTVLSKGFRQVGEALQAFTVPGWLGSRYRSRALQVGFSLLSLALVSFLVLIVVAMAYVLSPMLGLPVWAALAGVIALVFTYVLLGGANTSVYTNAVQAGVMIVVALTLVGSGGHLLADGPGPFLARLEAIDANLVRLVNPQSPYFRNLFEVLVCNFVVGLALVCQPHVMGKALSLKSQRDVNRYLLTAVSVGVVFMLVMLVGLYARLTLSPVARIDLVVPTYIETQFSPAVGVLIGVGVLCAGVSTLEGILLALCAILAADLFLPALRRRRPDRTPAQLGATALRLARAVLVLLGGITFALGLHQVAHPTGGSVAIFAQYGIYCLFSASFAPMLFGMFLPAVPRGLAMAAALGALVIYLGMSLLQLTPLSNNPAVLSACAIFGSTALMAAGAVLPRLTPGRARRRLARPGVL